MREMNVKSDEEMIELLVQRNAVKHEQFCQQFANKGAASLETYDSDDDIPPLYDSDDDAQSIPPLPSDGKLPRLDLGLD